MISLYILFYMLILDHISNFCCRAELLKMRRRSKCTSTEKPQSPVLLSLLIPRTYQLATYVNLWKMEKLQLVSQLLNALKIHQITQVVPKSSGVFTTAERSICHLPWTWEAHREKVIFSLKYHIKFLYLWDFSNTIGFFDI